MSAASRGRLALAHKIAPAYVADPRVCAVAVTGSVSRGRADRYSDIELGVFWAAVPTDDERRAAVARAGGDLWHVFPYDEHAEEWGEDYYVAGVKIDAGSATVGSVERRLSDVVDRHDAALSKQHLAAALQHAVSLHGAPLIERWQQRIASYPEELARAMVRQHLRFNPIWGPEMLAERGELLELHAYLASAGRKILAVLLGLNRIYHPGHKWVNYLIGEMTIAPPGLARRLRQMFLVEPSKGVELYRELTEELFGLVEQHLPDVDTAAAKAFFRHRRPLVEYPSLE
jgi:hypothetical protein